METADAENREYGGLVYRDKNGRYHAVAGEPGPVCEGTSLCYVEVDTALSLVPEDAVIVGDWHTHMVGREPLFGRGDIAMYNSAQASYDARGISAEYRGGYMGSHDGNVYFYRPGTLDVSDPLKMVTQRDIRNASSVVGKSYPQREIVRRLK